MLPDEPRIKGSKHEFEPWGRTPRGIEPRRIVWGPRTCCPQSLIGVWRRYWTERDSVSRRRRFRFTTSPSSPLLAGEQMAQAGVHDIRQVCILSVLDSSAPEPSDPPRADRGWHSEETISSPSSPPCSSCSSPSSSGSVLLDSPILRVRRAILSLHAVLASSSRSPPSELRRTMEKPQRERERERERCEGHQPRRHHRDSSETTEIGPVGNPSTNKDLKVNFVNKVNIWLLEPFVHFLHLCQPPRFRAKPKTTMFSTLLIAKTATGAQLANIHVGNDNDYAVTRPHQHCPTQSPSS
ncbi:hypothetical protein T484DRAFT_3646242 [Baffinella frigidus]|nr:hypothetical protein T484DRAFT_3646242 [Cryptophyta sp. CCMP2293]